MLHCRISALVPLALGLTVSPRTQGQTNPPPVVQQQKPAQVSRMQSTTLPPIAPR